MTNLPNPLARLNGADRVVEEVHNPETDAALTDAEASVTALDELRRKVCEPRAAMQKSRWRLW
jgi:3-deoxy-D-arabino-heptulosonate 7-phosphate (DAHP) synthase